MTNAVTRLVDHFRRRRLLNKARISLRHYERGVDIFCENSFFRKVGTPAYRPFVVVVFGGEPLVMRHTSRMIAEHVGVSYLDMNRLSFDLRRGFSKKEENLFALYLAHKCVKKGPVVINADMTSSSVRDMARAIFADVCVEPIYISSSEGCGVTSTNNDPYLSSGETHTVIFEKGKERLFKITVMDVVGLIFSRHTLKT